jgi:uncharacterized membrane protein YfcA
MESELILLIAALAAAGVFAGLVAGMFGIGGGVVIVPALYYALAALGYPEDTRMHVAVATSLTTIVATSIRSVMSHNRRGAVDWDILRAWSPWIVLGAALGAALAGVTPGRWLTAFFGFAALLTSLQFAFGSAEWRVAPNLPKGAPRAGLGALLGGVSVLMGIGGGTFGVLLMTLCGRPIHRAVATAAGFGVAIGVPGVIGFVLTGLGVDGRPPWSLGYVSLPGALFIGVLTVLMTPVGVHVAHALPALMLRRLFALCLALTAASLLYKSLG